MYKSVICSSVPSAIQSDEKSLGSLAPSGLRPWKAFSGESRQFWGRHINSEILQKATFSEDRRFCYPWLTIALEASPAHRLSQLFKDSPSAVSFVPLFLLSPPRFPSPFVLPLALGLFPSVFAPSFLVSPRFSLLGGPAFPVLGFAFFHPSFFSLALF